MHKGSCLCGAVKYQVQGDLGAIVLCHCSRCRKANGSAFASNAPIDSKDLVVVEGAESLKSFRTEAGVHRMFCQSCGSPIFSWRENNPEVVRIRIGTLDTPIAAKPSAHIFMGSKAEWENICDDLPRHHGMP